MISAKWLNIFIKVIVDKWLEHNEFVFRRSTKWILWQHRGSSRSWLQIPHRSGRFGLHVPLWQSSTKTPTRYFLWHSSISFQGIIPVQLSDRHSSLQVFYDFLSWSKNSWNCSCSLFHLLMLKLYKVLIRRAIEPLKDKNMKLIIISTISSAFYTELIPHQN